jgi:hypothetical protein
VLLPRFDPPGCLNDFDSIPDQLDQWSAAVSGWFDGNISIVEELTKPQKSQFYNETKTDLPGPVIDQVIGWNALPGTLRNRWGRSLALRMADDPLPLTVRMDGPGSYYVGPQWEKLVYRPQDEYCEWHVTRDKEGRIVRVTFTSEPPEYWQALHGDTLPDVNNNPAYEFTGDKHLLVDLYQEYVSPEVTLADLECQDDFLDYTDPRNPAVVYPKGSTGHRPRGAHCLRGIRWAQPLQRPDHRVVGERIGGAGRVRHGPQSAGVGDASHRPGRFHHPER